MATEILKSFSHLQTELEEAKTSLKGVDENIKRLIGRDPSELAPRPGQKRTNNLDDKNNRPATKLIRRSFENDESKRRNTNSVSVFKRLSDKVYEEPNKSQQRGLISKVIAAPKEIPSRQDVLDKQNKDERFKARNKRMFGALLGTLQRFQQDECKLKKKEEKRTQIEKKIEEHEQQEKEEIKKERQELFLNRKKKQQEIKMIELKMLRMKEYAAWEESQRPRIHFIATKAKPHIHYLPRKMNDKTKELLEKSKTNVEEQIEKRRQEVFDELNHIEERMKKNFESKNNTELKEASTNRHDRHESDSDADDDGDIKMKSPPHEKEEVEQDILEKDEADMKIKEKEKEMINGDSQIVNEQEASEIPVDCSQSNQELTQENNFDNNIESVGSSKNDIVESNNDMVTNNVDMYDNVSNHLNSEVSNENESEGALTKVTNEVI